MTQETTKLDILKELLQEFGENVFDCSDYDVLLEAVIRIMVDLGMVPQETPAEYANRIVEEMLMGSQRTIGVSLEKGSFDAVYFSADAENVSEEIESARRLWQDYCDRVEYVSVDARHIRMLDGKPSRVIADHVNAFLRRG